MIYLSAQTKIRNLTIASACAAIIFAVTIVVRIPVPGSTGAYLNFGDIAIYLSAFLFGGPVTAAAAAVGSALADTYAGSAMYIAPTFIIKGTMGLVCGYIMKRGRFPLYLTACFIGGAIMFVGYGAYELAVFGLGYALASVPLNLVQWIAGALVAAALYPIAVRLMKTIGQLRGGDERR